MRRDGEGQVRERAGRAAAFGVHLFTASGAALAMLALIAAVEHQWPLMFALLGLALLVDGLDGTLARVLHVQERAPRWSGDVLDLVVDVLTYVFVPAYAVFASDLFPETVGIVLAIAISVTGVLYFADRRMKSADNYFIGFPAVWNLVVFYLFLLQPGVVVGSLLVAVFCVLTFVPFPFVHPIRVQRFRIVNIVLLVAWGVLALLALLSSFNPGPWISIPLSLIALYFTFIGVMRTPAA